MDANNTQAQKKIKREPKKNKNPIARDSSMCSSMAQRLPHCDAMVMVMVRTFPAVLALTAV